MTGPLLVVHHRAGNDLGTLRTALDAGVDLVEADVHAFRGRLEVRHLKSLGPRWLWDRWELVRRTDADLPELPELIQAAAADPRLLLDLKGVHPRLAERVASVIGQSAVTVCTQHWWMLPAFDDLPQVRVVLSAGSRRGLRRLRSRVRRTPVYGVSVHRRLLTPAVVTELRRHTDVVLTWPVDTDEDLEHARSLGVGGVIGKDLRLLRTVLATRSS
jgi:hypothetical protein